MARVLIVGFSVTTDTSGYAPRTAAALRERGIEVDICGIGGINVEGLAGHLRALLGANSYDWVALEIATSILGLRVRSWEVQVIDAIYDLLWTVREHGARAAFINLFRADFEYDYHQYDMLLESIAARYGIPLLDLAAGLERSRGRKFSLSTIRDVTHTKETGAQLQAESVTEFLTAVVANDPPQSASPRPRIVRTLLSVSALAGDVPSGEHHRCGFSCSYVSLAAGQHIDLAFDEPRRLFGIGALSHPRAGDLAVLMPGQATVRLSTYHEASYYEHYVFRRLAPARAVREFRLQQLETIPQVQLRKGEPDVGPRTGLLVDLHVF